MMRPRLLRRAPLPLVSSLALAVAALLGPVSCDNSSSTPAPSGGSAARTIAVIPKGTTHEFWKSVHAGAKKAADEYKLEMVWKGPLREDDREDQIKVVEDFVTQQVDGIVLAPLDDTALRAPVAAATKANVPVVIIDSDLKSEDHKSFCATDNVKGGEMAGEELARLLGGKGKVVMLRYSPGSASTTNREEGFLAAVKKHPGIEVVSANQYAGATTEAAYQASENLLAPLKSGDGSLSIQGIFCPNEPTTFGMLRALQDGNFAGKVKFVGFDTSSKMVEGLEKGHIDALVVQDPFNMGYQGVKTMAYVLRGEEVAKRIDTGAKLVTKANMNEPEIKNLLHPPAVK
jgi:ribose transport system substrate-binding protein